VYLSQASNVIVAQFEVTSNTSKVSHAGAVLAAGTTGQRMKSRELTPGLHRVLAYSLTRDSPWATNRQIGSIPFTVSPHEYLGSGPLAPTNAVLVRRDETQEANVTLNPGSIFVQPVYRRPDGTAQFFLPSTPGTRYLIQATADFVNWVNLTTVTAQANFTDLIDADAARYPHRFYRWVLYDAAGEIGAVTQLPGGKLSFQLTGLAGRTYVLQASADLQVWTDLSTNVATTGTLNFTNLIDPAFPKRFFRLKSD
jgi:hypothetical protein